jgi:hypothetical protein
MNMIYANQLYRDLMDIGWVESKWRHPMLLGFLRELQPKRTLQFFL